MEGQSDMSQNLRPALAMCLQVFGEYQRQGGDHTAMDPAIHSATLKGFMLFGSSRRCFANLSSEDNLWQQTIIVYIYKNIYPSLS